MTTTHDEIVAAQPAEDFSSGVRPACGGLFVLLTLAPLLPNLLQGVHVQSYVATLLSLCVLFFVAIAARPSERTRLTLTDSGLGILLFVASALFSLAPAHRLAAAAFAFLPLCVLVASHLTSTLGSVDATRTRFVVLGAIVSCGIVALFGIVGYREFVIALRAGATDEAARANWLSTPFYPHSYIAAQVVAPLVPFGIAVLLSRPSRLEKTVVPCALALVLAFIALVLSRAILLAVGVASAVVVLTRVRGSLRRMAGALTLRVVARRLLAALAILALVVVPFRKDLVSGAAARFTSLLDPSALDFNFSRLQVWSDALRLAADNLPFGVGIGQFATRFAEYDESRRFIPHAHDQYVQVLAETGILGIVGFSIVMFGSLALARRALHKLDHGSLQDDPLLRGAFGALIAIAIIDIFETPLLHVPCALELGFVTGVIAVRARIAGVHCLVAIESAGKSLGHARSITLRAALVALLAVGTLFAFNIAGGRLANSANEAYLRGDYTTAADLADRAATLQPLLDWPHWLRADSRMKLLDYEGAKRAFEQYEAVAPRVPDAQMRHAVALGKLHREQDALDLLMEARLRAPPEFAIQIDIELANQLTYLHRDEEARVLYLDLTQRFAHEKYPDILRRFSECCQRLGRDKEIAEALMNAYRKAK